MKIKNLYIENKKRLKNLSISFENNSEILDTVVLTGINGTGKTTVLEAIYDYFEDFENYKNKMDIKTLLVMQMFILSKDMWKVEKK